MHAAAVTTRSFMLCMLLLSQRAVFVLILVFLNLVETRGGRAKVVGGCRREAELGKDVRDDFDEYYRAIYGTRWPILRQALEAPTEHVCWVNPFLGKHCQPSYA
jgi:hypothetical protein